MEQSIFEFYRLARMDNGLKYQACVEYKVFDSVLR